MIHGAAEDSELWRKGLMVLAAESPEFVDDLEEDLRQHEERPILGEAGRIQRGCVQSEETAQAEEGGEEEEFGDVRGLTRHDKALVQRMHNNLGHPSNIEMAKALRMARARNAVWRYAKNEFRCQVCERNVKPKPARPAMLPKSFEPSKTVGIDVVFFPGLDVRKVEPVLNMVDWATGYQMLEPLQSTQSSHVWEKFYGTWVRKFGVPEVLVMDQDREFGKDFAAKVTEAGSVMKVIGARAPWQQGRTERHGGLAKEVFVKLREDILPTVKTLSVQESLEVERQLRDADLLSRIMPSRIVRRWKPSEQPGIPPSRKSRWCVRGDQDPDLMDLSRHAPTVTTATLAVVLQIAASCKWAAAVGDLRNAFMQSDMLKRPAGRLFCRQPKGGLPGLQSSQLIEILAGAYGLGDAPAHWRKSLKKVLFEMKFQQSALDPCVFKWFDAEGLQGLLVVEVDDLFAAGSPRFFEMLKGLQQRFQFGKFVKLQEEVAGAAFNGRRIQQKKDFSFEIDMEKFVAERLKEVPLEKGRATQSHLEATEQERDDTRAAVGSITWAAKEGRPDGAAIASLVASSLSSLKVQDIVDLNKCIKRMKEEAALKIPIQSIPLNELCWGVITDASYANAAKGKSQGAFAVIAYDKGVIEKGEGRCNLMHCNGAAERSTGW